jgi:hypothetical protein
LLFPGGVGNTQKDPERFTSRYNALRLLVRQVDNVGSVTAQTDMNMNHQVRQIQ